MKIIITGGRDFCDKAMLYNKLDSVLSQFSSTNHIEIVTGGACGADEIGKQYALEHDLAHAEFPANWNEHGKSAGYVRNLKMVEYVDGDGLLVVFWDGESKGTAHMIEIARSRGMFISILKY